MESLCHYNVHNFDILPCEMRKFQRYVEIDLARARMQPDRCTVVICGDMNLHDADNKPISCVFSERVDVLRVVGP